MVRHVREDGPQTISDCFL
ncbi:hypothetical protein [Aminobacter sp. SS-2016]